jgi:allene oxide cyclase-like protein
MKASAKLTLTATPLAAAAIGVLAIGGASAAPVSSNRTIRATEHIEFGHLIDRGPHGFSAGDQTEFGGELDAAGKAVGSLTGSCTSVTKDVQQCLVSFKLPGGRIAAQGRYTSKGRWVRTPIVGGTGDFRRARGQIIEHQTGHGHGTLAFHVGG